MKVKVDWHAFRTGLTIAAMLGGVFMGTTFLAGLARGLPWPRWELDDFTFAMFMLGVVVPGCWLAGIMVRESHVRTDVALRTSLTAAMRSWSATREACWVICQSFQSIRAAGVEMAGGEAAGSDSGERRRFPLAARTGEGAAWMEMASARRMKR